MNGHGHGESFDFQVLFSESICAPFADGKDGTIAVVIPRSFREIPTALGFVAQSYADHFAGTLIAPAVSGREVNMMGQLQSAEVNTNGRRRVFPAAGQAALTPEVLRNIVLRHCACYEVWPEWSGNGGRATRIGFAINICGIHENGAGQHDVPGCPHCWRTYNELRVVAEWITPEHEKTCRFEIAGFDRAWHVASNARQARNETVVTIKIFHRHNIDTAIDDCQQECLNEMRVKLAELGIRENVWAGC